MTATPSKTHAKNVHEAISGQARHDALGFLANFHKSRDGAGKSTAAAVSTIAYIDTRTLAASATENLDLSGGVATFTKVHAIYVKPAAANGAKVAFGGAAANTFVGPFADATDIIQVGADQEFLITSVNGWTVTAGTGDILKVANLDGAHAATYDILILGE
jgi:hypothetical protein